MNPIMVKAMVDEMDELKKLYIEPTSRCNLNCNMCFRNTWFDESYCDMKAEVFQSVMHSVPNTVETIFFGGMGEPLFHQDIISMITQCHNLKKRTELLTNGTLLTETMIEQLIIAGLDTLWISMDQLEPSTQKGIGHIPFESLIEAMKRFHRVCHRLRSESKLGITFVATKSNVSQLRSLPFFIDHYMINEVNISNFYPSNRESMKEALYEKTLGLSIGSDVFGAARAKVNVPYMDFELEEVKEGLGKMMEHMNFKLYVGNLPAYRRSHYCRFIEEGMCFVRSDGNVSPCMALLHNGMTTLFETERKIHHHSFGSMQSKGLKEIWESKEYVEFRTRVREFSFSPCTNCGHCSYPESNETDCFGNVAPTCGACLWAEGLLSCP